MKNVNFRLKKEIFEYYRKDRNDKTKSRQSI